MYPGRFYPVAVGAARLAGIAVRALLSITVAGPALSAKDWPQWRSAERLGVWTKTGIVREFPTKDSS